MSKGQHEPKRPLLERFWEKVDKRSSDECWLWTGAVSDFGHGVIGRGGRGTGNERAHRLSYRIHKGPIPPGMLVCHTCDNPRCVNPAHLFLGTQRDNMDDCRAKGRHAHGETSYAKLTAEQVLTIRRRYAAGGISQAELGRQYGVVHGMISLIIRRERWQHL